MDKSLKLLVVDDSQQDAEAVVQALEQQGFTLGWRQVDSEARLRAALRSRWDVVISDCTLESMQGLQVLEVVRQHDPALPFIFVCEPVGEQGAVALMCAGARDCLQKGCLERLAGTVERELEQARQQRQRLAEANTMAFQQRRYQSIFDTAPVALLEVDLSAARRYVVTFTEAQSLDMATPPDELLRTVLDRIRVLAANAAAAQLLGADRPEQVMNPQALRSVQRNVWLDVVVGLGSGTSRFERQLTLLTLDGREVEVLLAVCMPASPGQLRNLVMSLTEVGLRQQLKRPMQAAQRMEAVGRLAGRVAHDFNNLLTVIKGYSGLLIETLPRDDPARHDLRIIDQAASSAEQLTRQLSSCNRPQSWEPEVLSVNHLISRLDEGLKGVLGEQADLFTELADGLWEVEVDPIHLEEMLVNLAANARDAMRGEGRLTIETANARLDGDGADTTSMAGGDYVLLTVTDNGCGMDPQTLQHSFDPFFSTRDTREAAGLGLSVVYGIVKQAGGLIWAESEAGVGSTFKILLPRRPAPDQGPGNG